MNKGYDEELYKLKSSIFKALSHPIRLKIIELLLKEKKCVCDIAKLVGSERSNVSKHISVLLKADLLTQEKKGLYVFYKVKLPCVTKFLSCAQEVIEKQVEIKKQLLEKNKKGDEDV